MKTFYFKIFVIFFLLIFINTNIIIPQRIMENLGRGAIAVKTPEGYFISWRLPGNEYNQNVTFNIYRDNTKLNNQPLSVTNFNDNSFSKGEYLIGILINGKETKRENVKMLQNNYIEIPLQKGNFFIQHAWPADLDGDGEYDYVLSRLPVDTGYPVIEAYLGTGKFLWRINMGPNSKKIAPGNGANDSPPASISGFGNIAGYRDNDNITVYDLNLDGKAEIIVRTANGVSFADGKTLTDTGLFAQYITVINGLTGKEVTSHPVPNDFIADGPLGGHFGIAYLDGIKPSLITKLKNRAGHKLGKFNLLIAAWDFDGYKLTKRWKWKHTNEKNISSFHQIRIIDVNQDGKDEICDGSYVLNSQGKLLYGIDSCVHGDRFHITDIDPNRPGLEGYCIQQTENNQIEYHPWFYYDAANGSIIRNGGKVEDVSRGTVADIDPRHLGCEMWSVNGIYNVNGEIISAKMPTANFRIWWDGDLLAEILDRTQIIKWDYELQKSNILFDAKGTRNTARSAPPLYGDLFGDWREEILLETSDRSAFRIYTTNIPTQYTLYTLPHNPAYRACLTTKGYYQSSLVDFFLGNEMKMPEKPKIMVLK